MEKTLHEKLVKIQQELKAPKNQTNTFGGYKYRSCEDILEAVKPLLNGLTLILNDEVVNVGTKNYVQATAQLSDGKDKIIATAYAREAEDKKGMDDAQITGAASSYARKYALNGLFAIDDTKDADTMDNSKEVRKVQNEESSASKELIYEPVVNPDECKHEDFWVNEVKKEGPNKGKKFKSCKACKRFIGWYTETKEEDLEDINF